jgi:hypothetical protein
VRIERLGTWDRVSNGALHGTIGLPEKDVG